VYSTKHAVLLVIAALAALCAGCARAPLAPLVPAQLPPKTEKVPPRRPTWGPEAEGLQCRLRATKHIWQRGEAPTFKVDLRNRGSRIFAFATDNSVPSYQVIANGRKYPLAEPAAREARIKPLAPGVEFSNLPISLPGKVHTSLATGRHTIQLVFSFEGVEVVSNPVSIEIARGS
jgi:hypothetical protein